MSVYTIESTLFDYELTVFDDFECLLYPSDLSGYRNFKFNYIGNFVFSSPGLPRWSLKTVCEFFLSYGQKVLEKVFYLYLLCQRLSKILKSKVHYGFGQFRNVLLFRYNEYICFWELFYNLLVWVVAYFSRYMVSVHLK